MLSDDKYYFYTLSQRLCLLFLLIHSAFAALYNTMNVPSLVVINAVSIGLYYGALKLNLAHRINTAWALINIQMLSYAFLSSYILGNAGTKEMLMFLPMLFFLYPTSFQVRIIYLVMISAFYCCLGVAEIFHPPVHTLDVETFEFLGVGMNAVTIFVLAYFTFYIYRAVQHKEESFRNDHRDLHQRYLEMERLSITDSLTTLYNRQKIEQVLSYEIERSFRYNKSFSILLLDIDRFKSINDTYGHQAGDRVLISFAKLLNDHLRKADIIGRWGGEEFMVISPETDARGAALLAEKLRVAVERCPFSDVGKVTASFGVGTYNRGLTSAQFVAYVDEALYKAKADGRNRVVACPDIEVSTNVVPIRS